MKIVDRLRQQTNATSTATVMLGSSVVGFRTVAQAISDGDLAVGDEIAMCVESGTSWEISRYRVDSATQLTRLEVLSSWTGGDAVMFPGGGKEIFCTVPAEYLQGVPVSALQAMASVSDTTRLLAMNAAGELLTVTAAVLKAYMGGTSAPVDNSPTLSGASGAATGANSASGSVTTNEAGGTLYWLFSTASTATAAQVKAGSSKAVTASGVQNVSASGLTASTQYYLHFLHRDSAGQDSAVVTALPFTTQAAGTPSPTVTSVTISPKAVALAGGATQQFTGTAAGTNSPPQTFTFETNLGTVDANTGAYVAAAGTSSEQTAIVTMRSTLDPTKLDTATVTIAAAAASPVTAANVTDAAPSDIILTFGEAIDTAALPAASTFSVTPVATTGTAQTGIVTLHEVLAVAAVAGQPNQLKVSVRWPFWKGEQARNLVYSPNGTNDLKKAGGAAIGGFTKAIAVEAIVTRAYTVEGAPKSGANFPSTTEAAPTKMNAGSDPYAGASVGFYIKRTDTGLAAKGVRFVWGTSPTVPPCSYNDLSLPIGATGNTSERADGVMQAGRSGGWTDASSTSASYYSLFASSSCYARGAAGTRYLWVLTHDGFQYCHPTPWYLSAP